MSRKNFAFMLVLILTACGASNGEVISQEGKSSDKGGASINSSLGSLADIRTGMTEEDLLSLGYPSSRRSVVLEGDEYTVVDVAISKDVSVECLFDSGKVEFFSVTAVAVRDEKGMGVGSSLFELKHAYPQGKVLIGDEDGRYANFVNESRVVFELDQDAIDLQCFESHQEACDIDSSIEVVRVVVHSGPAG